MEFKKKVLFFEKMNNIFFKMPYFFLIDAKIDEEIQRLCQSYRFLVNFGHENVNKNVYFGVFRK